MNQMLKNFLLSMADACASRALLFGMWGNSVMASYFEQVGKFYQQMAEKIPA